MVNGNPPEIFKWLSFLSWKLIPARVSLHLRLRNPNYPDFLDKANHEYKHFHNILDHQFKGLKIEGIGSQSKHAEVITKEEEKILWDTKTVILLTLKGLLRAVFFYYNGNFFVCVEELSTEPSNCLS